ncbi:hypothetical protein FN846DRAFT_570163 [Sphaerosporella brunnea]|uniref:LIM zinc-binding domain-containing protein n=1 Tax=Sphaerosporella brunnea TaxID=1250544 RepID=A0A5J5F1Z2_9PEZI|nr:hypothetical protein FN846DRAFT_570163 [Sphaerosporella brunnea]
MATTARESSLLPHIKCSGCGLDVEISQLGDHVCGAPSPRDHSTAGALASLLGFRSVPSSKPKPARIDPYIANNSHAGVGSLTPGSSNSASRTHSPATPRDVELLPATSNSGLQAAQRKPSVALSPYAGTFPPSEPVPRTGSDSPTIPPKDFYDAHPPFSPTSIPPLSPGLNGGRSLMDRMNTIAPGPFDVRRGSDDAGRTSPMTTAFSERGGPSGKRSADQLPTLAATYLGENRSTNPRETVGTVNLGFEKWRIPEDSVVPRLPDNMERSSPDSTASVAPSGYRLKRADTIPLPSDHGIPPSPSRASTLPLKPGSRMQRVPPHGGALPVPPPEPLPPLRIGSPYEYRAASKRYEGKPHAATLSVSSSSTSSAYSHLSKSSMSSPPGSDISLTDRLSGPNFVDPKTFNHAQHKRPPIPSSNVMGEIDSLMDQLNFSTSPPDERQPSVGQRRPSIDQHQRRPSRQHSREPLRESLSPQENGKSRAPPPLGPSSASSSPVDGHLDTFQKGHKRVLTSKGPCRGCGEHIFGKSVSSADNRVTGRWHKQCFVCQKCRMPFASAEFYVLDNLPFCHRHYHELNNSLCKMCDFGIEGPCLETMDWERYHPNCFTCTECRCILDYDYFEINGRPFCEQHARRFMQPRRPLRPPPNGAPMARMGSMGSMGPRGGPGRSPGGLMPPGPPPAVKVERRRTRLMFMGEQPSMPGMV